MKVLEILTKIFSRNSRENTAPNLKDMEMAEQTKNQKRYQWIKGDRFGDVVDVAETQTDNKWLHFSDGTRINKGLISEFLMEVKNEREILKVPTDTVVEEVTNTTPIQPEAPVTNPVPTPEATVMGKMIQKMSKKNVVNVPLDININIPTPAIYAMLNEGMEAEDLNEEIMSVALAQIEINKLQEYIKEQITNFLIEYYG